MKIVKYLYKPIKYLIYLSILAAIIFYRSVIFHANVNQYIDMAMSYVESQFEITIPAHVEVLDVVEIIADDTVVTDLTDYQDDEECTKYIEKEIAVEEEIKEDEKIIKEDEKTVEKTSSNELVDSNNVSAINSELIEDRLSVIDKLSETINIINNKIDKLFVNKTQVNKVDVIKKTNEASIVKVESFVDSDKTLNPVLQKTVVLPDTKKSDSSKILFIARQTYWNGNTDLSEKYYIDLARYEDSDPDVYGELGNVYYSQGKWKQAGEAYFEAAIRLLDLNRNDQVNYLLRVIQGLDTASADKLKQKISG